jgi:hypothetical protein
LSFASERSAGPRSLAPAWASAAVLLASVFFYYGQNVAGRIGGPISIPKLLWLDYALVAWFVVPFFVWRSPLIAPELRRVYGFHLLSFTLRGLAELWMLYVTVSWRPAYGIAHDAFDILLITALVARAGRASRAARDAAARHFLFSIRATLACEIVFAALFERARAGQLDLYFASADPLFATINALTAAVVVVAYLDLLATLFCAREALFPRRVRPADLSQLNVQG